jgi:DMSO reductase family type II enzyme heme b subunit
MQSAKVNLADDELLDPVGAAWSRVPAETIDLSATPLASQPSSFVRSYDPAKVGRVKRVEVQTVHNDSTIFFRLSWQDEQRNLEAAENNQFPDGCGILLPLDGGDPPMQEMGGPGAPVNAWFWRADFGDQARNVVAEGLGTTRATEHSPLRARSAYEDGAWHVVLARRLVVPEQSGEVAPLNPGSATRVGFAVWEGGNGERGGLKAFSREWRELDIA